MPGSLFRDRRWVALIVLCTGMLMIVLDNTVVNVALSSLKNDLGFSEAGLAWVVNGYMIAFGGFLLLAGRLGDLIGAKRVFMTGIVLFTLASLLCGLSTTQTMLVASRFVQGIGGALASSVILAMIFTTFQEGDERAQALSMFSFTASAGGSVGLLVGGALTQLLNWHWIFLVNVPIGIATWIIARRVIAGGNGIGWQQGADILGAAMITSSLMLAVYSVVQIPTQGVSASTLILAATSITLLAGFVFRQATISKPLLPLGIFRGHNVVASNVVQVFIVAGLFGFFFLYSLYLRRVLGYDAVRTGLAFLPVTASIGILSSGPAAKLVNRFGARATLVAGLLIAAAGQGVLTLAPASSPYMTVVFPGMLLIGVGIGVAFPSTMIFAMSSAKDDDSGLLSGLVNTTAEVGGALGLAALAAISALKTVQATAAGASAAIALTDGYRLSFGIGTVFLIAGAAVSATWLSSATTEPDVTATSRCSETEFS